MNIVFIGAGKMATALAGGMGRTPAFASDRLSACDLVPEARAAFTAATGYPCAATPEAVGAADVLILAVKPQGAEAAVRELPPRRSGALIISICAGISLARLQQWFGSRRLVRVMPNTPLLVGAGASCFALADADDRDAAGLATRIFGSAGMVRQVSEEQLDAVTALSGSGPAYFFEFAEALRQAGVGLGLPDALALELAVQTMAGSAEMLRRGQGTPLELRRAVTSPGGTTAAALAVMEQQDFRGLVAAMLAAARDRSRELGS